MIEYSLNKVLFNSFIQGWMLDEDLTNYFFNKFQENLSSGEVFKNSYPRNYWFCNVDNNNFNENKIQELLKFYAYALNAYNKKYFYSSPLYVGNCGIKREDFMIKYFEPNEFYSEYHCELTINSQKRNLSTLLYLNDISLGGETEFFYQNVKIKPKKGLLLIWPAYWTHTHKGCKTEDEKFIISAYTEYVNKNTHLIDVDSYYEANSSLSY